MSSPIIFSSERDDAGRDAPRPDVLSEVAIERAKSAVVALRGVDDAAAERLLSDVADSAGVPLRVASDQALAKLESRADSEGLTSDALDTALDEVGPRGA
ncbi:hypothetical protein GCM10028784_20670 [Myceligenerans cantabricum]